MHSTSHTWHKKYSCQKILGNYFIYYEWKDKLFNSFVKLYKHLITGCNVTVLTARHSGILAILWGETTDYSVNNDLTASQLYVQH